MNRFLLIAGLAVVLLGGGLFYLSPAQQGEQPVKPEDPERVEKAAFNGFDLSLSAPGETCRLHFENGQVSGDVDLSLPPPCRFMRDAEGRPQFYSENGRQLIAVVGGVPAEDPIDPLTMRPDCGIGLAGIEFSDGTFTATDYTMGPGVFCALMGLEQREIWLLLNG
ncbi:hypothetical protein [Roseibium marinum]|uniref:Uncharacterized protein n=1 Tax=Roseibium marinum TaxID=281252 RepID=A0A2S3USP0_9HYPH|nr:hypothetical protein [Roseibium marinum]POF30489.1 hypothetical protein CLV41_106103 [Roseibium marinum]